MSVIVEYIDNARLGNRMFQIAFGTILASQKNTNCISQYRHIDSKDALSIRKMYGDNYVDYAELLKTNKNIIVDSFVQKYRYYIDFREQIKKIFEIDPSNFKRPLDDELVIHIRETDYRAIKKSIDISFYIKIIDSLGYRKNTVVTDDCNSSLVCELKKRGCDIFSSRLAKWSYSFDDNSVADFIYMLKSKHLLISHSTFAWWAGFLGEQEHVYYPDIDNSMWAKSPGKDDIDLFIPNSNFIKIS